MGMLEDDLDYGLRLERERLQAAKAKVDGVKEELKVDGKEEAAKFDKGKIRMSLVPQRSIVAAADVFTYGASKYAAGNWHQGKGFDWDRLDDALEGHLKDWRLGIDFDPESGKHHLAHALCCLMMLYEHVACNLGTDTRARNQHHDMEAPYTVGRMPE